MKHIFKFLTLAVITALIAACSGTKTTGSKLIESTTTVKHILIIANDQTSFSAGVTTGNQRFGESMDRYTSKIFSLVETQLPIVFALNGISGEVQLRSKSTQPQNISQKPASHFMTLTPTKAQLGGGGGFAVTINSSLTEIASKKVIWKGETRYSANGLIAVTETSANEFAKATLIQLKKDGVIDFPSVEPVMPK